MTAITEWGLHDRSATFSFYLTAHRCKSRPDIARSAANLADKLTIAGPNASDVARGAELMRGWYTKVGLQWLRRRLRPWASRLGEPHVTVEVRDLGYRWGSARPSDGSQHINVHWATLQLPPSLVDYILVHELAHLREANHTPEFWSIVARLMPPYETHKTTLAATGKSIWLGSVV